MEIYSFHLAKASLGRAARALLRRPDSSTVPGLRHAECLAVMRLGAGILSPARMQLSRLAVFARWESEAALDAFLTTPGLGATLAAGWHVRLAYLRKWGRYAAFDDLPPREGTVDDEHPVVAVTLARLKLPELPRFVRWGRPVEELVRDHPGATLALAAQRLPRTVSTFSVWRTQREMIDMVRGREGSTGSERHAVAMEERNRRDFHHEFTTLRFRPLSEHGSWDGRAAIVPGLDSGA